MADAALLAAGGDDAPLSYVVPGATAIRIKQIHVKYVDNSAGADWLPAVRIISDSKHRMGTAADQAVKVTAGSDADVSFFPGVKHAASSAGGFTPVWCFASKVGLGAIGPGTVVVTWTSLDATAAGVYALNAGDQSHIEISQPGIYLISGYMQTVVQPTSFTTGALMYADVQDASSTILGTYFGNFWRFADATVGDPKEVTIMHGEDYTNVPAGAAFPVTVRVFFSLGQAVNIGGATVTLTRLTPGGV
jgi:hypothetical protein